MPGEITLIELAELVGGTVRGDGCVVISGAATLADARAGDITLVDRSENVRRLGDSPAAAVVLADEIDAGEMPAIVVENVHRAFARLVAYFRPPRPLQAPGISPAAHIAASAQLGNNVSVHPGATIGEEVAVGDGSTIHAGVHILPGCRIGRDVQIMPGAVLYENTAVGDRVVIHAGCAIGAYGFGYEQHAGKHVLSAQLGYVEIGDDVEIGANTAIDRGTYGPTVIGEGSKIDNLVQIAHNCRIGKHNLICSQVGIAGSTSTGDYVVMAGQVGVRDHVHIGARAILGAMAGITNDVPEGAVMIGIPATPQRDQKILQATLSKLPEMRKQLKALQQLVDTLATQSDPQPDSSHAAA